MKTPQKYLLLFFLFSLLSINISYSQPVVWQKLYRGGGTALDTYGTDVCPLNDGGFLVFCSKYNTSNYGVFIVRIDAYGNILDSNFITNMNIFSCAPTIDNGSIIIGYEVPPASSLSALKINSSGQIVWKKNYTETQSSDIFKIIRTQDNKFICCGSIDNFNGFAMKIDENGGEIWKRTYPATFIRNYKCLIESNTSGYLLSGVITDSPTSLSQGLVTKIDTSGFVVWDQRYSFHIFTINKISPNYLLSIYDSDTAVYQADNTGYKKIDENGNVVSGKLFFAPAGYEIYNDDCKVINPNKYLFLNCKLKMPYDTTRAYSFFTDSSGNILRTYVYGGFDYSRFAKGYNLTNGGYIFIGDCVNNYPNLFSAFVVRADSNLYAPPVSVNNISTTVPDKFSLKQNYPNPFNSTTQIEFGISKRGHYSLKIYDVSGKLISELFNQTLEPGEYKTDFNASNYSSGVYFYKLESATGAITKKLVLLK